MKELRYIGAEGKAQRAESRERRAKGRVQSAERQEQSAGGRGQSAERRGQRIGLRRTRGLDALWSEWFVYSSDLSAYAVPDNVEQSTGNKSGCHQIPDSSFARYSFNADRSFDAVRFGNEATVFVYGSDLSACVAPDNVEQSTGNKSGCHQIPDSSFARYSFNADRSFDAVRFGNEATVFVYGSDLSACVAPDNVEQSTGNKSGCHQILDSSFARYSFNADRSTDAVRFGNNIKQNYATQPNVKMVLQMPEYGKMARTDAKTVRKAAVVPSTVAAARCTMATGHCTTAELRCTGWESHCIILETQCNATGAHCTEMGTQRMEISAQCMEITAQCTEICARYMEIESRCAETGTSCMETDARCTETGTQRTEISTQCTEIFGIAEQKYSTDNQNPVAAGYQPTAAGIKYKAVPLLPRGRFYSGDCPGAATITIILSFFSSPWVSPILAGFTRTVHSLPVTNPTVLLPESQLASFLPERSPGTNKEKGGLPVS
ncbi:hypothetical protein SAMN05444274_103511 [Mariniphaga anaerophila]|uniref:Uncharacterized protein n=1 Tax=Mariniphaga anaerophila TaxID=1484053 RepID=A0A1M4YXY7_9BACT|nr:hypothetical protein [Mariniphaga anaerophila]SHF10684.1 hypothetical protein SAMN05444274_103511 [Mariniphaga anaerophila]